MTLEELVISIIKLQEDEINPEMIRQLKRKYAKINHLPNLPTNIQILKVYNTLVENKTIQKNKEFEDNMKKRWIRSLSGIIPVQVLMKPHPCPWKCIFCPDDKTMPKSYINTEPGAMRALLNEFDPYKQVYNRLLSLKITGHNTDKIEMIVLGWTFDVYPTDYKISFIKWIYDACNSFESFLENVSVDDENPKSAKFSVTEIFNMTYPRSIEESIKINEDANCKIIWLTIETRAEFVTDKNCQFRRKLWVTRIEMWVQSLFDDVLEANGRCNTVDQIKNAVHKMRQYWFKISLHFMPWLYKSSVKRDIDTIRIAFEDPYIKPDEIKYYPTSVIPNTKLYDLYKTWEYKAITTEEIEYIIEKIKLEYIPPFTRLKRVIRDIPENEIVAGSKITNLRQLLLSKLDKKVIADEILRKTIYSNLYKNSIWYENITEFLSDTKNINQNKYPFSTFIIGNWVDVLSPRNFVCLCTRCREIRNNPLKTNLVALIVIRKYQSSVWDEYFISFEDDFGYLYWFTRLLLPNNGKSVDIDGLGEWTAIIRELHIYWQMAKLNEAWFEQDIQHKWFWTKLMDLAEKIAKLYWYKKLSVISWIWVRNYYKKLWYKLIWTYMVKEIR